MILLFSVCLYGTLILAKLSIKYNIQDKILNIFDTHFLSSREVSSSLEVLPVMHTKLSYTMVTFVFSFKRYVILLSEASSTDVVCLFKLDSVISVDIFYCTGHDATCKTDQFIIPWPYVFFNFNFWIYGMNLIYFYIRNTGKIRRCLIQILTLLTFYIFANNDDNRNLLAIFKLYLNIVFV